MEIQASQLILSATVIFIVGLLIFSVVFQAYSIMEQYKSIGTNQTAEESRGTFAALSIIPTVLTIIYFLFIGIVIWYVMKKSKEKTEKIDR